MCLPAAQCPGLLAMVSMLTVLYNPLSMARARRLQDVLEELKHVHICAFPGTQLRKTSSPDPYICIEINEHIVVSWGYAASPFTNKSAGCAIAFAKSRFHISNITRIMSPPRVLQGRAGAILLQYSQAYLCPIVLYFPPKPTTKQQKAYICQDGQEDV